MDRDGEETIVQDETTQLADYVSDRKRYFETVVAELRNVADGSKNRLTDEDNYFLDQASQSIACKANETSELIEKLICLEHRGDLWDTVSGLMEAAHEIGRRGQASQHAMTRAKRDHQVNAGRGRAARLQEAAAPWQTFVRQYASERCTEKPSSSATEIARNSLKKMPASIRARPNEATVTKFVSNLRKEGVLPKKRTQPGQSDL